MAIDLGGYEFELVDDGTLDTVIQVTDPVTGDTREYRYSQEFVAEYRDNDGVLDLLAFCDEVVYDDVADDEEW